MPLKKLRLTPDIARAYIFIGVLLMAFPSIAVLYKGHTGKFLVATGSIQGGVFYESVIYVQRHNLWGAFGVIINKPIDGGGELQEFFPELSSWNVSLYNGGPVGYEETNHLLITGQGELLNNISLIDAAIIKDEFPEVYQFLDQGKNDEPYRLFTGYSGWGFLQLNMEIVRGGWAIIDYDEDVMFNTPHNQVWEKAMERVLEDRPPVPAGV